MKVIAGPCSIDHENKFEVLDFLKIKCRNKPAFFGTRVVGLKSRTSFDPVNSFVGIDIDAYEESVINFESDARKISIMPSIQIANEIQALYPDTYVATEIVDTWIQCAALNQQLKSPKAIVWNPAVNHLGFPIKIMARYANKNNWLLGIKNGKHIGGSKEDSEYKNKSVAQDKSWSGLRTYANILPDEQVIMIHRGLDCESNEGYRNFPSHNLAGRVKNVTKCSLFLDPSHICGPKMRDSIVDFTLDAMQIRLNGDFLYNGILIECGTAKSDTDQHITLDELENLILELTKFRKLNDS